MGIKEFKIDDYLERLSFSGAVEPTEDRLDALHRTQYHTIPFENFDIHLGRGISLEPAALMDKLVKRSRGGYCFELNGLFLMALKAFGFEARPLLARVHVTGIPSGRGHQIALVSLPGRQWITDVGFGGRNLRAPIPLELDTPRSQDGMVYRLTEADKFGIMLQTPEQGRWQDLYSFDLGHVIDADIAYGNHYASTHPSSLFTRAYVAARPTRNGAATLVNRILKRYEPYGTAVQELPEGPPYIDALKTHFGIELDVPYSALHPPAHTGDTEPSVF